MIRLVQRKGKFAVGYHQHTVLNRKPFDDLIVEDPGIFVDELARSKWITPGEPQNSPLLTQLTKFNGPMFRVFSEVELATIRDWIVSLEGTREAESSLPPKVRNDPNSTIPLSALFRKQDREILNLPPPRRRRSLTERELYYQLLNIEQFPDVIRPGLEFVLRWLGRAANNLYSHHASLPFENYSRTRLHEWFSEQSRLQVSSYKPLGEIGKSRDDVISEAVDLCPMIFIDGGWLQRWTNVGLIETKIGSLLYKIFSDEIGNGDEELNHPKIYRNLMTEMGISLPDHTTKEFSEAGIFSDESFLVPTFWLAISQFPHRFLPETLGLNLAMELSGVGGSYRTARDELQSYGFSTLFVDLHNTIDNVSSGHSAIALEAIEVHLEDVMKMGGDTLADAYWRRVWTGYRALTPQVRSWKEIIARPHYPY